MGRGRGCRVSRWGRGAGYLAQATGRLTYGHVGVIEDANWYRGRHVIIVLWCRSVYLIMVVQCGAESLAVVGVCCRGKPTPCIFRCSCTRWFASLFCMAVDHTQPRSCHSHIFYTLPHCLATVHSHRYHYHISQLLHYLPLILECSAQAYCPSSTSVSKWSRHTVWIS